jgi:hypothetical protein
MINSADVIAVRSRLGVIPGVGAVSVDLRKMQVEIAATRVIEASALRNALGNADFGLSEFAVTAITTSAGVRDDDEEGPKQT